ENIIYVHNTPQYQEFPSKEENKTNSKMKIAYIGILGEGRMIHELLDIVSRNNIYELHIGGFGQLEDVVRKYSNKYPNIIYYGKTSYEKTMLIESKCDILTALYDPSVKNHKYAAPNKFYESLMLGKPVIMIENT